jgi:hypothetical protein
LFISLWRCLVPELLRELGGDRLVVAVDPGKVSHRVWLADRERGLIDDPVSVSVANSRAGIEQRWPGALRLFAPSETQAARAQIGARRFKTDDRDCAALVWLARQGAGRSAVASPGSVR